MITLHIPNYVERVKVKIKYFYRKELDVSKMFSEGLGTFLWEDISTESFDLQYLELNCVESLCVSEAAVNLSSTCSQSDFAE